MTTISGSGAPTYIRWGNMGPTLVFLHYFGGEAVSWQWVAKALQNDYRCIAINLPGCGDTAPIPYPSLHRFAEFVKRVLDDLHIHDCTLIGHSMGAKIATLLAAEVPELFRNLILLAPSPPSTEPSKEPERQRLLSSRGSVPEAEKTLSNITVQPVSEVQRQLFNASQLATAPATWNWWLLDGMNHSIAGKAQQISVPVTVLSSINDPIITPQIVQQNVAPFFPEAQFISTHGVGHLLPFEAPNWVAAHIRNTIQSLS